jgi:DNA-binding transcriptional regulator YiaG
MTFADTIRSERQRLNLTQAEAAAVLEVPARTLWEWEHGKTTPLPVAQEGVIARLKRAKAKK